ncbi:hypothetical protein TNCT_736871 [Trichonephila clavata]|uniref:Uncharacterized protein n=1 Tax=Trichonephila clavata TaxID=2740835 RepID=A0A8X6HUJ7_TRICU|nr:hypothetical protein TNCT_736871 [Trichonephila clavata]
MSCSQESPEVLCTNGRFAHLASPRGLCRNYCIHGIRALSMFWVISGDTLCSWTLSCSTSSFPATPDGPRLLLTPFEFRTLLVPACRPQVKSCAEYWWTSLLFISNWFGIHKGVLQSRRGPSSPVNRGVVCSHCASNTCTRRHAFANAVSRR